MAGGGGGWWPAVVVSMRSYVVASTQNEFSASFPLRMSPSRLGPFFGRGGVPTTTAVLGTTTATIRDSAAEDGADARKLSREP